MKLISLALAASLVGASSVFGTIVAAYNIQSGIPATDYPILSSTGTPLPYGSGSVSVGYFSGPVDYGLTYFVSLAPSQPFSHPTQAIDGLMTIAFQRDTALAGDFIGKQIHIAIQYMGELGVWASNATFLDDHETGLENRALAGIVEGGGAPAGFGQVIDGPIILAIPGVGTVPFENGFQLSIPEPGAGLLTGLAGLALLIRRRR